MKNTLIRIGSFTAIMVAMASFGGNALVANAQTATPTNTNNASLQQQLDDAKAELIQLEMQAGMVPGGDASLPATPTAAPVPVVSSGGSATAMTLSATDIADLNAALGALATTLSDLETKASQDPQFIAMNGQNVAMELQDIGNSLSLIVSAATSGGGNVAMASPQNAAPAVPAPATPAPAGNSAGSAATAQVTPTPANTPVPVAANTPATTPANTAPQVAQVSSSFSFSKLNWPLIIVIVLIIAAIAIWLFWDDGEEKKQPVVKNNPPTPMPQKPAQPIAMSTMSNQMSSGNSNSASPSSQAPTNNNPVRPAQTPLASTMVPQDQKRKPA